MLKVKIDYCKQDFCYNCKFFMNTPHFGYECILNEDVFHKIIEYPDYEIPDWCPLKDAEEVPD